MTLKKAIVFTGKYHHGVGACFAGQLAGALAQTGMTVVTVDLCNREHCRLAGNREFYRGADLAFSVNSYRPVSRRESFRYFRETGCVFVSMLTQSPFVRFSRIITNNELLLCCDRTHLAGLRQYYRVPSATGLLLPGGTLPAAQVPWERRRYDRIYVGDYCDPEQAYRAFGDYPERLRRLVKEAIDLTDSNLRQDTLGALLELFRLYDFDLQADPDLTECLLILFEPLDRYIKARRRLAALRCLDEAGVSFHLWGDGYSDGLFRNHVVHPARPWDEIGQIMARSKMVLDLSMMPDGCDERPVTALCCGAVAVTLDNPLMREMFVPSQETLNFAELNALPEICAGHSEAELETIAGTGLRKAQVEHSWVARARQLSALVESVRQACQASG